MFGGGDRVAEGGVHDDHALFGRRRDVDVVHTDAGAADHFQVRGIGQKLFGHLGGGANREAVILVNDLGQFLFVFAEFGHVIDLDSTVAEDLNGGFGEFVRDENAGCHGKYPVWFAYGPRLAFVWSLYRQGPDAGAMKREGQAAWAWAAISVSNAWAIHGIRAATSAVSTVEPHQMRSPAGASR